MNESKTKCCAYIGYGVWLKVDVVRLSSHTYSKVVESVYWAGCTRGRTLKCSIELLNLFRTGLSVYLVGHNGVCSVEHHKLICTGLAVQEDVFSFCVFSICLQGLVLQLAASRARISAIVFYLLTVFHVIELGVFSMFWLP